MNRLRNTLRRLLTGAPGAPDAGVHFHRRGGETEACYDADCRLPHLSV